MIDSSFAWALLVLFKLTPAWVVICIIGAFGMACLLFVNVILTAWHEDDGLPHPGPLFLLGFGLQRKIMDRLEVTNIPLLRPKDSFLTGTIAFTCIIIFGRIIYLSYGKGAMLTFVAFYLLFHATFMCASGWQSEDARARFEAIRRSKPPKGDWE